MVKEMSIQSRKELLRSVHKCYEMANWNEKGRILDGFIAATGYRRKYAITVLNSPIKETGLKQSRQDSCKYDNSVIQALKTIWYASNQICSKRLVPFLPDIVSALERHGHLSLPPDVRKRVLSISASTVDRLLKSERRRIGKSIGTTRPGTLLKHQIKIRTFADWDNVVPGFMEGDLVAHCGGDVSGVFLNTLTLTDISTGWTECLPLLRKSAKDVINGLNLVKQLLPFRLQGLDTDNGSEFINNELIDYCEKNEITFTRSRAYRKNDQAHVEEKNGSVVRRIVGYDRYEGVTAWEALARLYGVLRLYVNFFQPSLKLLKKERQGARVRKSYDPAKTPYQRVMLSEQICDSIKERVNIQYLKLDPIKLMTEIRSHQDSFWELAWKKEGANKMKSAEGGKVDNIICHQETLIPPIDRHYHQSKKPRKKPGQRTWRTRKDSFENVWSEIRLKLELNPQYCAKIILEDLMIKYPGEFKKCQIRTLQRRVAHWRGEQEEREKQIEVLMMPKDLPQALDHKIAKAIALEPATV